MKWPNIKRPERLREEVKKKPPDDGRETEQTVLDQDAVRAMLNGPGWAIVRRALIAKNELLWNRFRDPRLSPEQAAIVRVEAVKYSGIEDVLEEILRKE